MERRSNRDVSRRSMVERKTPPRQTRLPPTSANPALVGGPGLDGAPSGIFRNRNSQAGPPAGTLYVSLGNERGRTGRRALRSLLGIVKPAWVKARQNISIWFEPESAIKALSVCVSYQQYSPHRQPVQEGGHKAGSYASPLIIRVNSHVVDRRVILAVTERAAGAYQLAFVAGKAHDRAVRECSSNLIALSST